ncbi:MAG: beta-N-acetylhexosaminidase [Hyphomicrobiales bacterium]|nr:beta-N-acetylhexosaminidase [Hyphomicrobiales bacterium]
MSSSRAFVCGCEGDTLTDSERRFFRESSPWGFILFQRNISTPDQTLRLVEALREAVGRDAPVLIDQEGGRVARLRPPHWNEYPPAETFGNLAKRDFGKGAGALDLCLRLMSRDVAALGVDVMCLPVLDVPVAGAHDVIGDRAYGGDAELVAKLGRVAIETLLDVGMLPVAKHVPGHGRARADSHASLPVVDSDLSDLEQCDFVPFKALSHVPIMMTAHILYTALDPDALATFSARVIGETIRAGFGFDGLLISDDLSMNALSGTMDERARRALEAGCDIALHCNGKMPEMEALAGAAPMLAGDSARRSEKILSLRHGKTAEIPPDARARLNDMLA